MRNRVAVLLGLAVALMVIAYSSIGIYAPALPAMATTLGGTPGEVQLTFSAYMVAFAVGQLIYGPLSDRLGRRVPVVVGLAIYVAGSLACAAAASVPELVAARGLQALGGCAGPVLARAMMRDLFVRDEAARMWSYVGMAMAVVPALAPVAGGYLFVAYGWEAIFLFLSIVGGVVLAAVALLLRETHAPARRQMGGSLVTLVLAYPVFLRSPAFLGYTLTTGFSLATAFVFVPSAPFVLIELLGVSPNMYGWCVATPTVFNFVGGVVANRSIRRLGGDRLVLIGAAITAAGGLLMVGGILAGVLSVPTIVGPMCLVTMGGSILFPSASQGAIALFPERAGAASSLNGFLQMLTAAAAVVVLGWIPQTTALPMGVVVAACALSCLAALILPRVGHRRTPVQGSSGGR